jgi:hypothetical protein
MFLESSGIVRTEIYEPSQKLNAISEAIQTSMRMSLSANQLVVLTTEPEPVQQSILNRQTVVVKPLWKWQESIRRHLSSKILLSDEIYPTQEDIRAVSSFAKSIPNVKSFEGTMNWFPKADRLKWLSARYYLLSSVLLPVKKQHFGNSQRYSQPKS